MHRWQVEGESVQVGLQLLCILALKNKYYFNVLFGNQALQSSFVISSFTWIEDNIRWSYVMQVTEICMQVYPMSDLPSSFIKFGKKCKSRNSWTNPFFPVPEANFRYACSDISAKLSIALLMMSRPDRMTKKSVIARQVIQACTGRSSVGTWQILIDDASR